MLMPVEIHNLIRDYAASMEEYPKRQQVHLELHLFFRNQLLRRLNEEFTFIFYPDFFQELHIIQVG